jgi:hypothetical protein
MPRFRDFDAALAQRGPITFKLADHTWTVAGVGMGPVAEVLTLLESDEDNTLAVVQAMGQFFEAILTEPELWREKSRNIGVGPMKDLLTWIIEEEVGMDMAPKTDDADPLARLPGSSSPSPQTGPWPAGVSPQLASSTP